MRNYTLELAALEEEHDTLKTAHSTLQEKYAKAQKRISELEQEIADLKASKPKGPPKVEMTGADNYGASGVRTLQ